MNDIAIALLIGTQARAARDGRHLADLRAARPARPSLVERLTARLRPAVAGAAAALPAGA